MAKGVNQKLKMLYLARIFMEETDDEHGLTMAQLISKLKACDVNADRKTLYLDIDELRRYGLEIFSEKKDRNWYYHLGAREFELPELKLLVDSVQAAKFITDSKSKALIAKLSGLVSNYEARQLNRQVVISGRVKSMNESIYYSVDAIHEAINADRQIRFRYFRWNVRKEMELRKDGAWYQISPWGLIWDDENYYMLGYDSDSDKIKHYRVDKMLKLEILDEKREGHLRFKEFDLPQYTKSLFGMFGGEEMNVTLEGRNDMVGVVIDRFGKDIFIIPKGEDHFRTTIPVTVSRQFIGWIMALGEGIRVVSPDYVIEQIRQEIERLGNLYKCHN